MKCPIHQTKIGAALDTHTLIWLLEGDENLSQTARFNIENSENTNFVSVVTFWEIAIKVSIGKLEMQAPIQTIKQLVWKNGIEVLPISIEHTLLVSELPFHHRDPFDRLLIAQASKEKMAILSRDEKFLLYEIETIW